MPTLADTIQAWLDNNIDEYTLPLDELAPMFAAHQGELAQVSCKRAVASTHPEDDGWTLFLPACDWSSGGIRLQGSVFVVPTDGDAYLSDWATIRERPEFWGKPDTLLSVLDMGSTD